MEADRERAGEEAAGWLILLDDDPSDEDRHAEFRAWLELPGHRAAWESVSRTGALLASVGKQRATQPPDLSGAGEVGPSWRAWTRRPIIFATVLALCGAVVLAPSWVRELEADHATGTAQVRSVVLGDGSTVQLGPDSAIRLGFSAGERRVTLLSGEAQFDVTPDSSRPFRVVTRHATTTVLGTCFDVVMLEESTSVSVARGHVEVDATIRGSSYELFAGDWVRVGKDGSVRQGADLPDYLLAGPGSRLAVRNRPVAEVVERLRPWFSGRIVIANGSIGDQPVTGVFDATSPADALAAIVGPQGGRVLRVTPWLLIVLAG
jgi:transmembrane sensor